MIKEINIFFNALLFYSRIRVPKSVVCTQQTLQQAYRYFPLVGLIVGVLGAAVLYLSSMTMPISVSVVLAMVTMTLLTGAFHEDGLADFADGFGAGRDSESIRRIMKDSHIGTYGVLTLILASVLKFSLISSLGELYDMMLGVVAAQGVSRFLAVVMLWVTPYLSGEKSKATHASLGVGALNLTVATVLGLGCLLLLDWSIGVTYAVVAALFLVLFRAYVMRRLSGCTGDVLGAVQQIAELLFYITMISVMSI